MAQRIQKQKGGTKKYGRNKRLANQSMSAYVRGKISFETYWRRINSKN